MTENITVNMENLNEEERKQLIAIIEKANKLKSKVWKPSDGEQYWYINANAQILSLKVGEHFCYDECLSIGNCFRNPKEAAFARERLKVIQQLKELGAYHKTKRGESFELYIEANGSVLAAKVVSIYGTLDFKTKKEAENAIKVIGEERLKKYYFCIED